MFSLGIDTSCYTSSVAVAEPGSILLEKRKVLAVSSGNRGLRQSEAVYQHIRILPDLIASVLSSVDTRRIGCVSVSDRPVDSPESFMPVFTVGSGIASIISSSLRVPLVRTAHQNGHIRAAQIGNERLLSFERFNALHLSGGTTDLLTVRQRDGRILGIENQICSADLHIGQFVDRVGVAMGLPFPAGPHLERLANTAENKDLRIPSSVRGMKCSFSGAESCALRYVAQGFPSPEIAFAVYDCMARTVSKVILACSEESGLPFLLAGGVSSSSLFRSLLTSRLHSCTLFFGDPSYCSDNACGVALIGLERTLEEDHE